MSDNLRGTEEVFGTSMDRNFIIHKNHFTYSVPKCMTSIEPFQAYDLLGLYFGLGRTFFNPASVSIIL
jgi:hypothetical protein